MSYSVNHTENHGENPQGLVELYALVEGQEPGEGGCPNLRKQVPGHRQEQQDTARVKLQGRTF